MHGSKEPMSGKRYITSGQKFRRHLKKKDGLLDTAHAGAQRAAQFDEVVITRMKNNASIIINPPGRQEISVCGQVRILDDAFVAADPIDTILTCNERPRMGD